MKKKKKKRFGDSPSDCNQHSFSIGSEALLNPEKKPKNNENYSDSKIKIQTDTSEDAFGLLRQTTGIPFALEANRI